MRWKMSFSFFSNLFHISHPIPSHLISTQLNSTHLISSHLISLNGNGNDLAFRQLEVRTTLTAGVHGHCTPSLLCVRFPVPTSRSLGIKWLFLLRGMVVCFTLGNDCHWSTVCWLLLWSS